LENTGRDWLVWKKYINIESNLNISVCRVGGVVRASLEKFKQFHFIKATVWFVVYFYLEQFLSLDCFPIRAGSLLPREDGSCSNLND
jgi:hypothetical protein